MKKNILIIFLTITTILFFIYSFVKADEAQKAMIIAEQQRAEVEKMRDKVVQLRTMAEQSAAEAKRQHVLAMEALAECQNK